MSQPEEAPEGLLPEAAAGGGAADAAPTPAAERLAAAEAALRVLGYAYTSAGELRSVEGGAPFTFVNQARAAEHAQRG